MDCVRMTVPADGRYVQLLRLSTSSMAVLSGFDVEAVEDAKIAVDELFAVLLELGDGSPIHLQLATATDGSLDVEASTRGPDRPADSEPSMNERVLELVATHHRLEHDRGRVVIRVRVSPEPRGSR